MVNKAGDLSGHLGPPVRSVCKAAGPRRIRLHDMRHTTATLMLQAEVTPVVVAGILGHSSAVLLTTYAHALPDANGTLWTWLWAGISLVPDLD